MEGFSLEGKELRLVFISKSSRGGIWDWRRGNKGLLETGCYRRFEFSPVKSSDTPPLCVRKLKNCVCVWGEGSKTASLAFELDLLIASNKENAFKVIFCC